jgi:hypothetical protein
MKAKTLTPSDVPDLPRLDAAAFRRELVGLSSPEKKLDAMSRAVMKQDAVRFISILPDLYGRDEPKLLWEYIAKALAAACEQVRDDDFPAWSSVVLDMIGCEGWKAAVNERWSQFQQDADVRPAEWREHFIRYVGRALGALLPLARHAHQEAQLRGRAYRKAVGEAEEANGG